MKKQGGITLIVLVITIIILLILAGITIATLTGKNGILNKSKTAVNETDKQTATEKINLKITTAQIDMYAKEQRMPTLQEMANTFCKDNEIQYVVLESKVSTLNEIDVLGHDSFFTKLTDYPYEFEINSYLQLASINGVKVSNNNSETIIISKEDYDNLTNKVESLSQKIETIQNNIENYNKITNDIEILSQKIETMKNNIYVLDRNRIIDLSSVLNAERK